MHYWKKCTSAMKTNYNRVHISYKKMYQDPVLLRTFLNWKWLSQKLSWGNIHSYFKYMPKIIIYDIKKEFQYTKNISIER